MREILFRGKRFSDGEWVIGGIMKTFHPNYHCDDEKDFFGQKPNCYCICANNKDYFVEQSSVGQYTGLTDKNGKKIFEGDIVSLYLVDGCEEGVIKFNDIMCRFMFFTKEGSYSFDKDCVFEIIGNIHDTPELLKGGE